MISYCMFCNSNLRADVSYYDDPSHEGIVTEHREEIELWEIDHSRNPEITALYCPEHRLMIRP